ncbi:alginate lyase family protein, partial [bacterium]|nr:alginate lyase family protein [bacterium]
MKIHLFAVIIALGLGFKAHAAEQAPSYIGISPFVLLDVKQRLANDDKTLRPALKVLIKDAEEALKTPPPSVIEKGKIPPGGDKHDYMTAAPYFWPDPSKSDGLPYIRHDGKVNPASRGVDFDHARIGLMAANIEDLALAYYFTGNETYAKSAA